MFVSSHLKDVSLIYNLAHFGVLRCKLFLKQKNIKIFVILLKKIELIEEKFEVFYFSLRAIKSVYVWMVG